MIRVSQRRVRLVGAAPGRFRQVALLFVVACEVRHSQLLIYVP